jgi:acyl-CoA thioesterase
LSGDKTMEKRPPDEHAREIIDAFEKCECSRLLGMKVTEAWEGGVRVTMHTDGKRGPWGVAHGGAVFALADQAFGIAANMGHESQVALSVHIQYLSPANGLLEAVAEKMAENKMCSVYRITVTSGEKLVAIFEGVGISVEQENSGVPSP